MIPKSSPNIIPSIQRREIPKITVVRLYTKVNFGQAKLGHEIFGHVNFGQIGSK
jgi:hypothetical protein